MPEQSNEHMYCKGKHVQHKSEHIRRDKSYSSNLGDNRVISEHHLKPHPVREAWTMLAQFFLL